MHTSWWLRARKQIGAFLRGDHRRVVCQHFHLYKNAGSTVDWALRNWFRDRFASYDHPNSRAMTPAEVRQFLRDHPGAEAFSCHNAVFEDISDDELLVVPIIFLRNPIDRAGSVYSFGRRNTNPVDDLARSCTFPEYVRRMLDSRACRVIADFHVHYCTRRPKRLQKSGPLQRNVLELAKERLRRCAIVGLVERFDESMVLAEHVLGEYFPGIDLSYVQQNISRERSSSLEERLGSTTRQLGPELMDELIRRNQQDLELHDFANLELDRRIRNIPRFAQRLDGFHKRCWRRGAA